MLVAISPADINYDETMSALRYADRAKQILCKAVINEDPNTRLIRELKEEVLKLREILKLENIEVGEGKDKRYLSQLGFTIQGLSGIPEISVIREYRSNSMVSSQIIIQDNQDVIEKLRASEKLIAELNETWEDKLEKTEDLRRHRWGFVDSMFQYSNVRMSF